MVQSSVATVWHSLLLSLPAEQRAAMLSSLTDELAEELANTREVVLTEVVPDEELEQTHASWFAPFLRTLAENDLKLFLSSLSPTQIEILKKKLLFSNSLLQLQPHARTYLRKILFEKVCDISPVLPNSSLNLLLKFSFEELLSLIELLSMHDLSVEIRYIIETAKLKEIYATLSKAQTTFLKTLMHRKEAVSFKKMGLTNWRGDRDSLRSALSQRGINRLAKALHGHDPNLTKRIAHRLDIEKGKMLLDLCTAIDHPRATTLLEQQVLELIDSIQIPHPSGET